jgi:pyruvate ferredoxin oxidoreductase gamma subunit
MMIADPKDRETRAREAGARSDRLRDRRLDDARMSMVTGRIHGRGGQGVVTAAELLSTAAFTAGKEAQAFPSFGSERMGAPVTAFCRIDTQAIRTREAVTHPDVLIVQDSTLLHQVELFAGLSRDGYVLINSTFSPDELGIGEFLKSMRSDHVRVVPASDIGIKHLRRPIANTPMLGAFAALTGVIDLTSVQASMRRKFPGSLGEANAAAAKEGYEYVLAYQADERSDQRHARTT